MKNKTYKMIAFIMIALCLAAGTAGCGKDKETAAVDPDVQEEDVADYNDDEYEKYMIRVVDKDLKPVEGAMVQLCSDVNCKMAVTDSDGTVTFDDPPAVYEVHVLKVPNGYKDHSTTYKTEDHYCDMVIVIEKE